MPERVAGLPRRLLPLVRDKYYVDEFYETVFVEGLIKKGGRLLWEIDARVVDVVANGTAGLTVGALERLLVVRPDVRGRRRERRRRTRSRPRGAGMRRVQTGRTQNYALTMAVGVFGFVCLWISC